MPWGRLDDSLYDHPKLARLEAEHRLTGVGLWAVTISWCNRYLTDGEVPARQIVRLGGTPELADELVAVGLFDQIDGGYLVHDFLDFNDSKHDVLERRKKEAARKAEWRRTRESGRSSGGTSGAPTHDVPQGHPVEPSRRMSRRDSRARDVARIPTRPDPTRPDPTENLSTRESAGAGEREDVQALLDRGWKRVTKAQRAVLDEVLDRHDATGAAFAAEVIRMTPAHGDPLAMVMDADRRWQETQRRRVDAEEQAWARTKAEDRNGAEAALSRIDETVKAWTP